MTYALAFLAAAIAAGFFSLLRIERDPTVRWWAGTWSICLFWMIVEWGQDQLGIIGLTVVDHTMTTLIAVVAASAALSYARYPIPVWLLRFGIAAVLVRGALALVGAETASLVLMLLIDPTLLLAGALQILRTSRSQSSPAISYAIGGGYAAGALILAWAATAFLVGSNLTWVAFAGGCVALLLGGLQFLAIIHSIRTRERREHRRLQAVIDTAPVGVLVEGSDGTVAMMNRLARAHMGERQDWRGQSLEAVMGSMAGRISGEFGALEELARIRSEGRVISSFELELDAPEAATLVLSASPVQETESEDLGWVWVSRDVTEERRMQNELRRGQRLDTIGRLAGGIAHDFNNQLTAILGNAAILRRQLTDPEQSEAIRDLESAAQHCAQLTHSLLSFSRQSPVSTSPLSIEAIFAEVRKLLRPLLPSSIELSMLVEPGTHLISADSTQVHQVLVNLAVNARDAIVDKGRILIRARNAPLPISPDEPLLVEISVSDDGIGMNRETAERVFEPFFSTKDAQQGTGLGLSIVHGVVTSHGGAIQVESRPGEGTTFRVLWPSAEKDASAESVAPPPARAHASGSETILVVDDETGLRRLARRFLEQEGYVVLEASDGDHAVEVFLEHQGEIGLLLLDVTMPRRTGVEALSDIRELGSEVPAILTSGLDAPELVEAESERTQFLAKPYELTTLADTVRRLLDHPA